MFKIRDTCLKFEIYFNRFLSLSAFDIDIEIFEIQHQVNSTIIDKIQC